MLPWLHRQYIYFCSLPLWFLQFVFLMRWNELFPSHSSANFVVILLSLLLGLFHIFYIVIWCDTASFTRECKRFHQRGFRLRLFFRGAQFTSRMIWLAYFWMFVGSAPFFILSLIMLLNHCYLFARGFLTESFHVITKFFIIPDLSVGVGNYNSGNKADIDTLSRVLYMTTHCAACIAAADGAWGIDLLQWLQWFEDLVMWAIVTGICDQMPSTSDDTLLVPSDIWGQIWTKPRFEGFYALGIISWAFGGGYYMVLRTEVGVACVT